MSNYIKIKSSELESIIQKVETFVNNHNKAEDEKMDVFFQKEFEKYCKSRKFFIFKRKPMTFQEYKRKAWDAGFAECIGYFHNIGRKAWYNSNKIYNYKLNDLKRIVELNRNDTDIFLDQDHVDFIVKYGGSKDLKTKQPELLLG